jgi:uncharacterized protein YggE
MRRFALSSVALAMVVVAAVGLTVAAHPTAAAAQEDTRSTISVVGDGRVLTQPDVAYVNLGVDATGASFTEAQNAASTQMQSVIDTLVGLGISRDDIHTSRLSANPVYDQRNNSVITGYRATNSVQVTLRDLDQVGPTVDAVTAAGANRVDGVSFAVENIEAPKNQARAQAMQNARAKADQLADLAGVHVVGIKSIEESDASATPLRGTPQAMAPTAAAAAPAPPVEPGTQEVRTQVRVTFIVE